MSVITKEEIAIDGLNIFEVIITAAKQARKLNAKQIKDEANGKEKPKTKVTTEILRRIASGEIKITPLVEQ